MLTTEQAADFQSNPKNLAYDLADEMGYEALFSILISRMSYDDVRDALDANEISPRFGVSCDTCGEPIEDHEDGHTECQSCRKWNTYIRRYHSEGNENDEG